MWEGLGGNRHPKGARRPHSTSYDDRPLFAPPPDPDPAAPARWLLLALVGMLLLTLAGLVAHALRWA